MTQSDLPVYDPTEYVPQFPSNCHSAFKRVPPNEAQANNLCDFAAPVELVEELVLDWIQSLGLGPITNNPGGGIIAIPGVGRARPLSTKLKYTALNPYAVPVIKDSEWMVKPCCTFAAGPTRESFGALSWYSNDIHNARMFAPAVDIQFLLNRPRPAFSLVQVIAAFEAPQLDEPPISDQSVTCLAWPVPVVHLVFIVTRLDKFSGIWILPRMAEAKCMVPVPQIACPGP